MLCGHSHARLKLISQNGEKYTDIWTDVPNDSCRIGYNGSSSLMINNGNAYAKTTVSSWHNDYRVFQAGQASMSGKNPTDGSPAYFSNNAYYDSTNSRWEFISTDDACQIEMENGSIKFKNGGTGSADGAITWATSATFNQSGNLAFSSGKGIDFSATGDSNSTTASELFHDYEEGTWTPTLSQGYTSITYNTQSGSYTKVGDRVMWQCLLYVQGASGAAASVTIGGFPFPTTNTSNQNSGAYPIYFNGTLSGESGFSDKDNITWYMSTNTSAITAYKQHNGVGLYGNDTSLGTGANNVYFVLGGTYKTDA